MRGIYVNNIKELTLRSGLTIICHGYVSRELLLKQINEYDIFVLPSIWYENAPLSILEAANFGLPVMVPNYGGLKEMASLTNSFSCLIIQAAMSINIFMRQYMKLARITSKIPMSLHLIIIRPKF